MKFATILSAVLFLLTSTQVLPQSSLTTSKSAIAAGHWTQVEGPVLPSISRLVEMGGYVFALSYPYVVHRSVYRSSDNGSSWQPAYHGLPDEQAIDITEINGTLYVCMMRSVYRSNDYGEHWERLNTPPYYYYTKLIDDGKDLYLFGPRAFARSTDGGDTWSVMMTLDVDNLEAVAMLDGHLFAGYLNYTGVFDIDLRSNPHTKHQVLPVPCIQLVRYNDILYAATDSGIYSSSDTGMVWKIIGLHGRAVRSISINNGQVVACTQDNEIHTASLDVLIWKNVPCDVEPGREYGLPYIYAYYTSESLHLSIGHSGVYRFREATNDWEKASDGLVESNVYQIDHIGDALFAACGPSGLHRSLDGGRTWHNISNWFRDKDIRALHSENGMLYAANILGENLRSSDLGSTWEYVGSSSSSLPSYAAYSVSEHRLSLDGETILNGAVGLTMGSGSNWEWLDHVEARYLRVKNGVIYSGGGNGISYSRDHGNSWETSAPPRLPEDGCRGIFPGTFLFFDVDGNIILGGHKVLSVTTNHGMSWSRLSMPAPNECDFVNEVELVDHTFLVSWGYDGLFRNTSDLYTWERFDEGLPKRMLIGDIHHAGNYIYLAGGNMGIWRRPVEDAVTSTAALPSVVSSLTLSQNYPNPVSGTTTISYAIPVGDHVSLTVTNALGQEVARLVDARVEAGTHSVPFSTTGLVPGVYFYSLRSGSVTLTKGMLAR